LFTKTILMMQASKSTKSNEDIDLIISDFGEFLNSEQQSALAMKYAHSATLHHMKVASLKHRLWNSDIDLQSMF